MKNFFFDLVNVRAGDGKLLFKQLLVSTVLSFIPILNIVASIIFIIFLVNLVKNIVYLIRLKKTSPSHPPAKS